MSITVAVALLPALVYSAWSPNSVDGPVAVGNLSTELSDAVPAFAYLGAACKTSASLIEVGSGSFPASKMVLTQKVDVSENYSDMVDVCMKKCAFIKQKMADAMPCTGMEVDKEGNCHLYFLNTLGEDLPVATSTTVSADATADVAVPVPAVVDNADKEKPLGCYKNTQKQKITPDGYAFLGTGDCISTQDKPYSTKSTLFTAPWSPTVMISYCQKICEKNQDCAGFRATDTCQVFMGEISSGISKISSVENPFGCYKKLKDGEEAPTQAQIADASVDETLPVIDEPSPFDESLVASKTEQNAEATPEVTTEVAGDSGVVPEISTPAEVQVTTAEPAEVTSPESVEVSPVEPTETTPDLAEVQATLNDVDEVTQQAAAQIASELLSQDDAAELAMAIVAALGEGKSDDF